MRKQKKRLTSPNPQAAYSLGAHVKAFDAGVPIATVIALGLAYLLPARVRSSWGSAQQLVLFFRHMFFFFSYFCFSCVLCVQVCVSVSLCVSMVAVI